MIRVDFAKEGIVLGCCREMQGMPVTGAKSVLVLVIYSASTVNASQPNTREHFGSVGLTRPTSGKSDAPCHSGWP